MDRAAYTQRISNLSDLGCMPSQYTTGQTDVGLSEHARRLLIESRDYIFVCGGGHSGTTLMLAILDSHKDITAVKSETGVFHRLKEDNDVLSAIANWPRKYELDRSARYIAEKTPVHCIYLERILSLLPSARIVLMIRDGRDAALSESKRLGDFRTAARAWRKFNLKALPFHSNQKLQVVRYEELVKDTENVVRNLCGFLEIEFDSALLNHHETERRWWDNEIRRADMNRPLIGTNHYANRNWQINQPIFDASERWRAEMTPEQKAIFKDVCGDLLVDLGYSNDQNW